MKSQDFCSWLKGWLEIREEGSVTQKQLDTIKSHLAMVFAYEIDPSFGASHELLTKIHGTGSITQVHDPTIRLYNC